MEFHKYNVRCGTKLHYYYIAIKEFYVFAVVFVLFLLNFTE